MKNRKHLKTHIMDLFNDTNVTKENVDTYCNNNEVSDKTRKRLYKYRHIANVHDVSELSLDFIIKFYEI